MPRPSYLSYFYKNYFLFLVIINLVISAFLYVPSWVLDAPLDSLEVSVVFWSLGIIDGITIIGSIVNYVNKNDAWDEDNILF